MDMIKISISELVLKAELHTDRAPETCRLLTEGHDLLEQVGKMVSWDGAQPIRIELVG